MTDKSDLVFMIFVNQDGVAYNWRWESADPHNNDLPMDLTDRFEHKDL